MDQICEFHRELRARSDAAPDEKRHRIVQAVVRGGFQRCTDDDPCPVWRAQQERLAQIDLRRRWTG